MNGETILKELEAVLLRYRAGLLTEERATNEIGILQAMLRAFDQVELERKLDRLQAANSQPVRAVRVLGTSRRRR